MAKLPRLQPIRYPAQEGQDVVFGLRLTIPNYAVKGDAHGWLVEVGKISDDSLKTHLVGNFVGCADNFYYFRVESREQTHTFLACLFLADLISREEAEIVLAKASPAAGSSAFLGTRARLRETIHRLPSLATLGGAYWAGQAFTAEVLTTSSTFAGAASATLLSTAPVAVGCLAVGGAMMLFSRSARAKRQVVGDEAMVETEGQEGEATGLVVWEGVRRRVDTDLIRTLTDHELADIPVFARLEEDYLDEQAARKILLPPAVAARDADAEGYSRQDFVRKVTRFCFCLACKQVLFDPVYATGCPKQHIVCKQPPGAHPMPPLPLRKTLVVGRNASCIGPLFGTGSFGVEEGPVGEQHSLLLGWALVATRCSWAGSLLAWDAHRASCPMERIRCEKCNTKYFQVDEAAHVAVCEEEDVDCPREGCEEFVLRRELDAHSLVCQFHPCPRAANNDCPFRGTPADLARHDAVQCDHDAKIACVTNERDEEMLKNAVLEAKPLISTRPSRH